MNTGDARRNTGETLQAFSHPAAFLTGFTAHTYPAPVISYFAGCNSFSSFIIPSLYIAALIENYNLKCHNSPGFKAAASVYCPYNTTGLDPVTSGLIFNALRVMKFLKPHQKRSLNGALLSKNPVSKKYEERAGEIGAAVERDIRNLILIEKKSLKKSRQALKAYLAPANSRVWRKIRRIIRKAKRQVLRMLWRLSPRPPHKPIRRLIPRPPDLLPLPPSAPLAPPA